ncbi:hypothetical protein JEG43_11990 [Anoxybacillus sp. LAT_35]|uniref:hypothetical protein n=1 Tax=unclassified Anoxybacillus TaxID=2639704 RepID=UPI001EDB447C|nr:MULTISPECIES: hypothetical protein [unclassified Anoxybacillus]MCG5026561.1 hypothetical protein [Anoxybacillus flavithermus]MCG6196824.1 hypothetical protein [Anoxybacillus sp. LAT_38]MCG3084476.1 hypothetical protein [Anoxybacillus sp. LAT27]MCG6171190.1 hypothetical protein [Anoxybacillus sp. LAT_11]MCG6176273.1 hypothetical protein [Anoxybacillus sp. LAT_31]
MEGIRIKEIRFIFLLTILIPIITINLIPKVALANDEENWIVRHILLNYKIEETSKSLKVYYVQIQQQKEKEPIIDPHFVKTIYLDENIDVSNKKLRDFVENDQSLYYDIYINDTILGKRAPIFADVSTEKPSEDEIQSYINRAIETIRKDFEEPPSQEEINKQINERMKKFNSYAQQRDYSVMQFVFMIIGFLMLYGIFTFVKNSKK